MPEGDYIDEVRRQWFDIHPELDTSVMAIVGRIGRIAQIVQARSDQALADHDLSRADFDVLSLLVRHGGTLTPTRIASELIISGAAVTKRVRHLLGAGLVARTANPADGRGTLIEVTAEGREVLRPILASMIAFETSLLADVDAETRHEMAMQLRALLLSLEAP